MLGWLSLARRPSVSAKGSKLLLVAVLVGVIPVALILCIIGCFYATIIPSPGSLIWAQAAAGIMLTAALWVRSRVRTQTRRMSQALALAIALPLIWLGGGHQAAADPAHLWQRQSMGDSGLQIALWVGDGIIGPKLVLDGEGRLVAVSPRSNLMTIQCKAAASCTVWDRSAGRAYRPESGSFQTGRSIIQSETVVSYPEDYDDEFGFAASQMTAAEMLGVESRALVAYPVSTLIAGLCWAMIWMILALGPMVLRRGDEKLFIRILAATATTGMAIALCLFSFILWALAPSTQTILLAHMVIGGLLAWLALWAFSRRRRNLAAL